MCQIIHMQNHTIHHIQIICDEILCLCNYEINNNCTIYFISYMSKNILMSPKELRKIYCNSLQLLKRHKWIEWMVHPSIELYFINPGMRYCFQNKIAENLETRFCSSFGEVLIYRTDRFSFNLYRTKYFGKYKMKVKTVIRKLSPYDRGNCWMALCTFFHIDLITPVNRTFCSGFFIWNFRFSYTFHIKKTIIFLIKVASLATRV